MSKNREYRNTAEIATFLHVNEGEAYTKSYTSVNEPLKVDSSKLVKKVGGVKVHMLVEEDMNVKNDGSFYEKRVWNEQERDNTNSRSEPYQSEKNYINNPNNNSNQQSACSDGLSPLQVLKNFVDNIAADNRTQWMVIAAALILAAGAIGIAILG